MHERVTAVGEQTSLADRKRRAGQRLVLGFPHPHVDDDLRRLVRELRPAGFVLFARNIEDPAQVRELNRELVSLLDPATPPLRCVDQEGGRVQRIREPATVWPPMRAVGRSGEHTGQVARALARELLAMGFDLDFAPVADVDSNPANPVIGDRSFGDRAASVARHVAAFIQAMQDEGLAACAKHFPGHGDTHLDSHHDLPLVERELPDLREVELPPFQAAVQAGVASVMTAHVVYPVLDEDLPATLSARVIRRLLREELAYPGVVFSDDLEMKAVAGRYPVERQVRLATEAGVDVLLVCHTAELQLACFEAMVRGQESHKGFADATRDAADRVMGLRLRFLRHRPPPPPLEVVGCGAHRDLAALVAERGGG